METVVKKVAYHLQVYDIIKRQILSGELKCGDKINEFGIAQSLGVSRSPVREAVRMLEQDELIVVTPSGLAVTPLQFENLREVYECRIVLESYAARQSVQVLTDAEVKQLERYTQESRERHQQQDYEQVVAINTAFHDMITRCCSNSHLQKLIEKNRTLAILARTQEFANYKRDERYLDEHSEIVQAIAARDPEKTERVMRTHISNDLKFYTEMYNRGGAQTP